MKVSDIHGWGTDPDLENLDSTWRVRMALMPVHAPDWNPAHAEHSVGRIEQYAEIYRKHGPNGMPPVVCLGSVDAQIAGMHRAYAAYVAGLTHIPAYVVSMF